MRILELLKRKAKKESLICSHCEAEIKDGDEYCEKDKNFYHKSCYKALNPKERVCSSCNMSIWGEQKYTKQMGLYFHRGCWNKERKAAPI